ncbi:MAG: cyclic-di-AMP receptor [Chloroflexi bacterium]|nr:cyclic-di-AMP receptor [Chloroflexota bacterium]
MDVPQKLLIAVVHQADAERVAVALRSAGQRFTRVPSYGGFLDEPNQTFFMALPADAVDELLALLAKTTEAREIEVPLVLHEQLASWRARSVVHGGATTLVVDLERIAHT